MPLTISEEALAKVAERLEAETDDFAELAKMSGLDPAKAYRYADLRDCDFSSSDLSGFDFTGADLRGCTGLPNAEEAAQIGLILTDATIDAP